MERDISKFDRTVFLSDATPEEQLAVETCPGYNQALDAAVADDYEWKGCGGCDLQVRTFPVTDTIIVNGVCPNA